MRFVLAALAYIADPAHWSGAMGIGPLLVQHVLYSLAGVGAATSGSQEGKA